MLIIFYRRSIILLNVDFTFQNMDVIQTQNQIFNTILQLIVISHKIFYIFVLHMLWLFNVC